MRQKKKRLTGAQKKRAVETRESQRRAERLMRLHNVGSFLDQAKALALKEAGTFWNGMPTQAVRGTAVVAPAPEFPEYWAQDLIGERVEVVRVDLDGVNYGGGVSYLDNRDGEGWRKVTEGHGGPAYPHKDLVIEEGSFVLAEETA